MRSIRQAATVNITNTDTKTGCTRRCHAFNDGKAESINDDDDEGDDSSDDNADNQGFLMLTELPPFQLTIYQKLSTNVLVS